MITDITSAPGPTYDSLSGEARKFLSHCRQYAAEAIGDAPSEAEVLGLATRVVAEQSKALQRIMESTEGL